LPSARPDAVHQLGGVARADLLHLDARVELVGEVPHEIAEVHPVLRVERHRDAAAAHLHGHVHDLDAQAPVVGEALARLHAAQLTLPPPAPVLRLAAAGPGGGCAGASPRGTAGVPKVSGVSNSWLMS